MAKIDNKEQLFFGVERVEGSVFANIGTNQLIELDEAHSAISNSDSALITIPLAPFTNRFEEKLNGQIDIVGTMWDEVEQAMENGDILKFKVLNIKGGTVKLFCSKYPNIPQFQMQSRDCRGGNVLIFSPEQEIEAKIMSVNRDFNYVDVTMLYEEITLESLKELVNKRMRVMVKKMVKAVPKALGVFVSYKGIEGRIPSMGLLNQEIDYHEVYGGKEIDVYLTSVNNEYVTFSENLIDMKYSNLMVLDAEREITEQVCNKVVGLPQAYNNRLGLFVFVDGVMGLVPRAVISDELWQYIPKIIYLGIRNTFYVTKVNLKKREISLNLNYSVILQYFKNNQIAIPESVEVAKAYEEQWLNSFVNPNLLAVGGVEECVATDLYNDTYLFIRCGSCHGMLAYLNMQYAMRPFVKEILASQRVLRLCVEEYNGRYSFNSNSVCTEQLMTLRECKKLDMEVVAINDMGSILLAHNDVFASVTFPSNLLVDPVLAAQKYPIGSCVEVNVDGFDDKRVSLIVSIDDAECGITYSLSVGDRVDVVVESLNGDLVKVKYKSVSCVLIRESMDNEINVGDVVTDVEVIYFDSESRTIVVAEESSMVLREGEFYDNLCCQPLLEVVSPISKGCVLAMSDNRYCVVEIDNTTPVEILISQKIEVEWEHSDEVRGIALNAKSASRWKWSKVNLEIGDVIDVEIVKRDVSIVFVNYQNIVGVCDLNDWLPTGVIPSKAVTPVGSIERMIVTQFDPYKQIFKLSRREFISGLMPRLEEIKEGDIHTTRVVVKLEDGSIQVDYNGIIGLVSGAELSWSQPTLTTKFIEVGDMIDLYVVSVDLINLNVVYSAKMKSQNPWLVLSSNVVSVVEVDIRWVEKDWAIVEYMGVLSLLNRETLCWLAGEPQLTATPAIDLHIGDKLELKIEDVDENQRIVRYAPTVKPPQAVVGEVYNMMVDSFGCKEIYMRTYYGAKYTLPAENITGLKLVSMGHLYNVGEWMDVKVVDENVVSLRETKDDIMNHLHLGARIVVEVHKVLERSILALYEGYIIELRNCYEFHMSCECFDRTYLRTLFTKGQTIPISVVSYNLEDRAVSFEITQDTSNHRKVNKYNIVQTIGDKYLVRRCDESNILGVATINSECHQLGQTVYLATTGITKENMYLLSDDTLGCSIELLDSIIIAKIVSLEEDRFELHSPDYEYLQIFMDSNEWDWERCGESSDVGSDLIDVKVVKCNNSTREVWVSRKSIIDDNRDIANLAIGQECGVTIDRISADDFIVKDQSGVECGAIRLSESLWGNTQNSKNIINKGSQVRVKKVAPSEFSIIALSDNPWKPELMEWSVGDVKQFSVSNVSMFGITLRFGDIYTFVATSEIYGFMGSNALKGFTVGQIVDATISQIAFNDHILNVTLDSRPRKSELSLKVGDVFEGEVSFMMYNTLYLNDRDVVVKVKTSEVSYNMTYDEDVATVNIGERHRCLVTAVDDATALMEGSIRELKPRVTFEKIENRLLSAKIKRVIPQGLDLEYDGYRAFMAREDAIYISQEKYDRLKAGNKVFVVYKDADYKHSKINLTQVGLDKVVTVGERGVARVVSVGEGYIVVLYNNIKKRIDITNIPFVPSYVIKDYFVEGVELAVEVDTVDIYSNRVSLAIVDPWSESNIGVGDRITTKIIAVSNNNLTVTCNGVVGQISKLDAMWHTILKMNEQFNVGEEVDCCVTEIDNERRIFKASIKLVENLNLDDVVALKGKVLQFRVSEVCATKLIVKYNNYWGQIPIKECSWLSIDDLASLYKSGDLVEAMCCDVNIYDATNSYLLKLSIRALSEDPFVGIELDSTVTCSITEISDNGLSVTFGDKQGWIDKKDLSWKFAMAPWYFDIASCHSVGQSVEAKVIDIDRNLGIPKLSIKDLTPNPLSAYFYDSRVMVSVIKVGSSGYLVENDDFVARIPFARTYYNSYDNPLCYNLNEQIEVIVKSVDLERVVISVTAKIPGQNLPIEFEDGETTKEGVVVSSKASGVILTMQEGKSRVNILPHMAYDTYTEFIENPLESGTRVDVCSEAGEEDSVKLLKIARKRGNSLSNSSFAVGDKCEITVLCRDRSGIVGYTAEGRWALIPFNEISYKMIDIRKQYEQGTVLQTIVQGFDNNGCLLLSSKAAERRPIDVYKRFDSVRGVVTSVGDDFYNVDLEYASARIVSKNVTWKSLQNWKEMLVVGESYDFTVISVNEWGYVFLSRLEELPFDRRNNRFMEGVVKSYTDKKIKILVDEFIVIASKVESEAIFSNGMGGYNLEIGAKVKLECLNIDKAQHIISVRIVELCK